MGRRAGLQGELIIIDECSMVDAELGRDLLSFGVPLLVLGDPAQLPPIQGGGFFTANNRRLSGGRFGTSWTPSGMRLSRS